MPMRVIPLEGLWKGGWGVFPVSGLEEKRLFCLDQGSKL